MKKLVSSKLHYHSFTWTKLPQKCLGNNIKAVEDYKIAVTRFSFVEFLVYLCVLGKEINKLQVIAGSPEMTPSEALHQILEHLLLVNSHEIHLVPENDTRGLAEFCQDILIDGKVKKYENENEIQVRNSMDADVFSEADSDE